MTFDQKQIAAAVALLALGFFLGRQAIAKAAASSSTAHNDTAGKPEEWWSFAGSWAT